MAEESTNDVRPRVARETALGERPIGAQPALARAEPSSARQSVGAAALRMVGGTAFFVLMAAFVKAASDEAHPLQAAFFRSIVSVPPVLVAMRAAHVPVASSRWRLLVARGVVGFAALCFYLWAVTHAKLANVVTLQQLSPLFVAVLSVIWLRERPRLAHYLLAGLCFAGALLVVRPTRGIASLGAASALVSALLAAVAYVSVRSLTSTEPTTRIVLWFSAVASLLGLPLAIAFWQPLSLRALSLLVGAGLVAVAGQTLMTSAYRRAEAHVAAAFSYSSVPLGWGLGVVAFGERPDVTATVGIVAIVVGGVGIAWTVRPGPARAPGEQVGALNERGASRGADETWR